MAISVDDHVFAGKFCDDADGFLGKRIGSPTGRLNLGPSLASPSLFDLPSSVGAGPLRPTVWGHTSTLTEADDCDVFDEVILAKLARASRPSSTVQRPCGGCSATSWDGEVELAPAGVRAAGLGHGDGISEVQASVVAFALICDRVARATVRRCLPRSWCSGNRPDHRSSAQCGKRFRRSNRSESKK